VTDDRAPGATARAAADAPGSICVFCGSSPGDDPAFTEAAREVGSLIARRGWTLVYGGGRVGLMGVLADAALADGGSVVGVIPRFLYGWEVAHAGLTRLELVETLGERKTRMGELAGAFLTLPGGIGTLDELFEALSWAQLGLTSKPSGVLNVNGYYDPLLAAVDRAVSAGFVRPEHRALLLTGADPSELLDQLATAAFR
jgi:uncharacterized protein (TIGR00730 family)